MGNYKFKLSDMMPNAWFYKLRDMSKPKNTPPLRKKQLPSYYPQSRPRHATSYHHYTTGTASETETETAVDKFCTSSSFTNPHFIEPPSKSSNKINSKRRSIYKQPPKLRTASLSTHCNCRAIMFNSPLRDKSPPPPVRYVKEDSFSSPDPEFYGSHRCRITASSTDLIIDVNGKSFSRKIDNFGVFQYEPDSVIPEAEPEPEPEPELELPPILTKPVKPKVVTASELEQGRGRDDPATRKTKNKKKKKKKKKSDGIAETTSSRSTGIKLRGNSPRIASKKTNQMEGGGRRSDSSSSGKKQNLSAESFAIVKSSFDPETDFKDSMVEMIIENNIRASKDLEELLALYLSLNSDEYHDLIVKAFEQIWFDMAHLRL